MHGSSHTPPRLFISAAWAASHILTTDVLKQYSKTADQGQAMTSWSATKQRAGAQTTAALAHTKCTTTPDAAHAHLCKCGGSKLLPYMTVATTPCGLRRGCRAGRKDQEIWPTVRTTSVQTAKRSRCMRVLASDRKFDLQERPRVAEPDISRHNGPQKQPAATAGTT
jgi:hypothetical protein